MKRNLTTLWMLLLMIIVGGGNAWAATYKLAVQTISSTTAAYESVNGGGYGARSYFSISGNPNYNDKFRDATYDGLTFTHGVKMESSNGAISFTTGSTSTVTIVQSTHTYNNNSYSSNTNTIKFDDNALTIASASYTGDGGTGNKYRVYTLSNVAAGSHSISRGSGESGIFYVCVEESSDKITPTSSFAYGNNCLAVIPVGATKTTVNNYFTTNSDGAVTYSITDNTTSGTAPTVDASGNVTVNGTGTLTVNAFVAATSTYAAQVNSYTLRVNQAAQFSVDIDNLKMLIPYGGVNASRNINRTIPNLDITFGGGDGVKFNSASEFFFRQSGTLELALRKGEGGESAAMTTIVLTGSFSNYNISEHGLDYYIQANTGTLEKTSDSQLTWTGVADDVTFTSQNRGVAVTITDFTITHNGYPLNTAKETPVFSFSPSSQSALAGSSQEYATTYTSSPGFFDAVSVLSDGDTGTTIKANQPVAGGAGSSSVTYTLQSGTTAGTATLTASNVADSYFNTATPATYTLTVGAGLSTLTEFAFNRTDVLYQGAGGNIFIDNTFYNQGDSDPFEFTYDVSRSTIRTKLNLAPGLSTIGASATSTYFAVESSDPTVLDVSSVSFTSANNGTRIYVNGIQVLKAGTATLTYRFLGSETYAATSCSIDVNVKPTIATYSGSYPFTWDFTSATSWDGSKLQATYHNSNWTYNGYHQSFQSTQSSVSADNGIDKIRGLAFPSLDGSNNAYNLFLDPGDNGRTAQLAMSGQMTVPNLSPDFEVTITGATGQTITPVGGSALTESPSGTYIYRPTTTGDVTFSVAEVGKALHTIQVTRVGYTGAYTYTTSTDLHEGTPGTGDDAEKYLIDGKERKLKGTYSFTGDGGFINGTTISDVPGITATFAKGSNELQVKTVSESTGGRYVGHVLTSSSNNATITFTPYVNGYLSLQGNFYSDTNINDGTSNIWTVTHNTHTFYADLTEITIPLIAGKTYVLGGGHYAWELHAFSFRPAFLEVENTEALTYKQDGGSYVVASKVEGSPFAANKGIRSDRYPKLIGDTPEAGEGKVKFAGERSIVNLYGNNNVDLLGSGTTIVKGTVLLEGSDEELFTYYYLKSTILELEKIGKQPNQDFVYSDTTAIVNQDYVNEAELENGSLVFHFNYPIERVHNAADYPGDVQFRIVKRTGENSEWTAINNGWTIDGDKANGNFIVKVGELDEGMTYQFKIAANVLKKSDDPNVMNSEIFLMFTVNKDLEAPIKMIYPTGIASLGTSIVLETYVSDGNGGYVEVDNTKKVKGILNRFDHSADDMKLDFVFSKNRLVFKPKQTLLPNTRYELRIEYDNPEGNVITMKDDGYGNIYKVTSDKAFYFTTGASAGTIPVPTVYSPANDPQGNVPVTDYASGRISITFDQMIEIEPYSTVYATPVNGRESTATATMALTEADSGTSLHVDSDGKTVYFEYGTDAMKYDLYYEVRVPVNTIVGTGGQPNNEDIKFRFRMAKNPNATEVDPDEFYPHTWDFNKFGDKTVDGTTAYNIVNGKGDPGSGYRVNSLYEFTDKGYTGYKTKNQAGYGFDQGADVYFHYKLSDGSAQKEVMDEFEGIRVSLVDTRSDRFELRNETSVNPSNKNTDGTDKWVFRMNGNTHYMTLSNVPVGKLYLRAGSNELIAINSPNATFVENDAFNETTHTDNTYITNTNGTKSLVINVASAGDVVFCLANFSCEKIAVAVDDAKKFNDYEGKSYTTEYRPNATERYDLSEILGGYSVTAKVPTAAIVTDEEEKTGRLTLTEAAVIPSATPVILVCSSTGGPSVPLFAADVNTATPAVEGTNLLVGNPGPEKRYAPVGSYILTTQYRDIDQNGNPRGDVQTGPLAFYRVYKANYNGIAANRAYLSDVLNPGASGAKLGYYFVGDDDTPTVISQLYQDDRLEEDGSSTYYNINGQKLSGRPTVPGIYISNGKKIIIK